MSKGELVKTYIDTAAEIEDAPQRVHALLAYAGQFDPKEQADIHKHAEAVIAKIGDPAKRMNAIAQLSSARARLQAHIQRMEGK